MGMKKKNINFTSLYRIVNFNVARHLYLLILGHKRWYNISIK